MKTFQHVSIPVNEAMRSVAMLNPRFREYLAKLDMPVDNVVNINHISHPPCKTGMLPIIKAVSNCAHVSEKPDAE